MSDWGAHVVSEKLSEAMKLVEKDIKAKKASDKVKKKNSLSTSGVQDDDQHILDPPTVRAKGVTNKRLKSALEKSKKVAKVRYTSQLSPPNTIVSGQHNQETINAPSNMPTSYPSFHDFYNQVNGSRHLG
ncbi:unnamed protein product [Malus baccata var. baccata]